LYGWIVVDGEAVDEIPIGPGEADIDVVPADAIGGAVIGRLGEGANAEILMAPP
jgi:hypothetical protein